MLWARLSISLALVISGCSGPYSSTSVSAVESQPAEVKVIRTSLEKMPEVVSATGELIAEDAATVGVKVPGRAVKLHVDIGSVVQAGQVLAALEASEYQLRVQQAEALVNQSRARLGILDNATDDVKPEQTAIVKQAAAALKEADFLFRTTEELRKSGVVSNTDFQRAQVRRQAAEASYDLAKEEVMQMRAQLSERRAQLALARQNLADCTIRAPFAGAITRRHAGLGEYLQVNTPVVTLVRQDPLRLRLEVPERAASKIHIGQRIDVRLETARGHRSGRVVRLSPAIEAQSRSLLVEGEIPNSDGVLRPGAFAEASITVDPNATGLAVPASAVRSFAGVDRVFIARGGVLDDRVIKTGRKLGDRVEVISGLDPGLDVVASANDRMSKGQRVIVR